VEITIHNILLISIIVFTGLSSGLCFTWSNAVTTGLARLDDYGYLSAFQQMNRSILNPMFFIVFFGPFLLNLINLCFFRGATNIMWLLVVATAVYFFGVVLITIFGNVPLNEMLDKTDLGAASIDELKQLRDKFEDEWNRLHLIRTATSIISFLLLIITALIKN